jgi:hypothetical protein
MNRNLFFFLVLIGLAFAFVGCATMQQASSFTFDIQYETDSPAVSLSILPSWGNNLIYGSGFSGFKCTFTNNTDKVVRVIWDQSSINYNGKSYAPFLEGQKYIDAQNPMSSTAIAKSGTLSKNVYSSDQPNYTSGQYGGWSMLPINSTSVELILCIKSDSGEEYITAIIDAVLEIK